MTGANGAPPASATQAAWLQTTGFSLLVLATGIVTCSMSFVFIRESVEAPVMLAAWRVLLAALMLSPLYWRARRRHGDAGIRGVLARSWLPGTVLGAHFITWVIGARLTTGANANLLVNLVPLAMPFLMLAFYGERLQRHELVATGLALCGLLLLGFADVRLGGEHLPGDAVCLLSMLLFALYLALARRTRDLPSVWLYLVPMYAVAGVCALMLAPLFGSVKPVLTAGNLLNVVALALVSTVIGHSALNHAMQNLRGQTVSVLNLFQFVVAGIAGYLIYREVPQIAFYPASALVVIAVLIIVLRTGHRQRSAQCVSAADGTESGRNTPASNGASEAIRK